MGIELVTGKAGEEHISSADDGALHAYTQGEGRYILDGFDIGLADDITLAITPGDLLIDGRHIRVGAGTTVGFPAATTSQQTLYLVLEYRVEGDIETVALEMLSEDAIKFDGENILDGADSVDVRLAKLVYSTTSKTVTPLLDAYALPADKGGTGNASFSSRAILTTDSAGTIQTTGGSGSGALYKDSADSLPVLGTLPVAKGGTGATSVSSARSAWGLGATTGAVPVANGGTGATTAKAARSNLGIGMNLLVDCSDAYTGSKGMYDGSSISGMSSVADYDLFVVTFKDYSTSVLAIKQGSVIRGMNGWWNDSAHLEQFTVAMSISGSTLNIVHTWKVVDYLTGNYGWDNVGVLKIYGVM